MKKKFKKYGLLLLDIIEIYIPSIVFIILFGVFIIQVFFRYALNQPLTWPYEVTVIAYLWVAVLGACLARRNNEHVAFTLIYDKCEPKKQTVIRIMGNLIIFITFLMLLYPSYDYVKFMAIKKSTVLRIPFSISYFPFIIFVLDILGRTAYDIVKDFKQVLKKENVRRI